MIYITGDTHCPHDIGKLNTKSFPIQKELTKEDMLIICGDGGFVWDGSSSEKHWQEWMNKKTFTTLVCDGNHENFDLLATYPIVDFHGGRAIKINDSLYYAIRGEIYTIEGKTYFIFGGARSSDKEFRVEGKSFWTQEEASEEEKDYAFKNLMRHNMKVDFIVTHCVFASLVESLGYEANQQEQFFQLLREKVEHKRWFCGHYHLDREEEGLTMLYDEIKNMQEYM